MSAVIDAKVVKFADIQYIIAFVVIRINNAIGLNLFPNKRFWRLHRQQTTRLAFVVYTDLNGFSSYRVILNVFEL